MLDPLAAQRLLKIVSQQRAQAFSWCFSASVSAGHFELVPSLSCVCNQSRTVTPPVFHASNNVHRSDGGQRRRHRRHSELRAIGRLLPPRCFPARSARLREASLSTLLWRRCSRSKVIAAHRSLGAVARPLPRLLWAKVQATDDRRRTAIASGSLAFPSPLLSIHASTDFPFPPILPLQRALVHCALVTSVFRVLPAEYCRALSGA